MIETGFIIKDVKQVLYWKSITKRWVKNVLEAKIYQTENQAINILNDCGYWCGRQYDRFNEAFPYAKVIKIKADITEES